MNNIQQSVMKKVYAVYAVRKAQVFSVKTVIAAGAFGIVAALVSFADIYENSVHAWSRGGFLTYMMDAFSKTGVALIALGITLLILGLSALNDIRNIASKRPQ